MTRDVGHRSRQDDGTYLYCAGPVTFITVVGAAGRGGMLHYTCEGCGKKWSMA